MRNRNHVRLMSEGFSFHTLELKISFRSHQQFHEIVKHLKSLSSNTEFYELEKYEGEKYFCGRFSKHGIRIYLSKHQDWYIVKLIINPRLLIDKKASYLGIMLSDEKSLEEMEHRFTDIMRKAHLPDFLDDWFLTRMDLCVNLQFDRKKLPLHLIQLISRGPAKNGFVCSQYAYPSETHKGKSVNLEKHAVKFQNDRIALVLYDKAYQAKKENIAIPDEMITRGILRIELQCGSRRISEQAAKHNVKSTHGKIALLSSNSREYLMKYVNKLLISGEYCQLDEMIEKIKSAHGVGHKTKKRMEKFAVCMYKTQLDFNSCINQMSREFSSKKIRRMLECFEELKICPIPLNSGCKLSKILSIPDILELHGDDSLDIRFHTKKRKCMWHPLICCSE